MAQNEGPLLRLWLKKRDTGTVALVMAHKHGPLSRSCEQRSVISRLMSLSPCGDCLRPMFQASSVEGKKFPSAYVPSFAITKFTAPTFFFQNIYHLISRVIKVGQSISRGHDFACSARKGNTKGV